jgi:hypothetical protein
MTFTALGRVKLCFSIARTRHLVEQNRAHRNCTENEIVISIMGQLGVTSRSFFTHHAGPATYPVTLPTVTLP